MNLIEALQKQIKFCEQYEHYNCGVFVVDETKRKIVMGVISNMLPVPNRDIELRYGYDGATATFPNGSIIRIITADSMARGFRYNGQIIDNDVNRDAVNCFITPYLMPRNLRENSLVRESMDEAIGRVYHIDISWDDVEQSKKCKRFETSEDIKKYIQTVIQVYMKKDFKKIKKEYKCMFINDCDRPLFDRDLNGKKVLLYNAWGIPKDNITYETEFINKTKQSYLKIEGEYVIDDMGIERKLNVRLPIDTEIYDGFGVTVSDGMVRVELYEIENEKPELKDLSR